MPFNYFLKKNRLGGQLIFVICMTILLLSFISGANASIGYDIHVIVNNSTASSTYGARQSTSALGFQYISSCSGVGNSSKYQKIDGLAGNSFKETMYTKEGRLISSDQLAAISYVNYIQISESVYNNSFTILINESLPTLLYHKNDIYYRGAGIHQKNSYTNNEDRIESDYYASEFTKSTSYAGIYMGILLKAHVIPGQVLELGGKNYSTAFRTSSESDQYSEFGFASTGQFIEDVYIGKYGINRYILEQHTISNRSTLDLQNYSEDWLMCCLPKLDL